MRYVFRTPLTIINADKADPEKIGHALEDIAKANGGSLTPHAVLDVAKNTRHVLHRHFTWDDAVAAKAHRLHQARVIIRAVRVVDDDAVGGHIPAFVSINADTGSRYKPIYQVKESVDLQAQVLAQAERDLEAWRRRYQILKDVCSIVLRAQELLKEKIEQRRNEKDDNSSRAA